MLGGNKEHTRPKNIKKGVNQVLDETSQNLILFLHSGYKKASTIFRSQFTTAGWHEKTGEMTLADAILDRIVYDSHTIEIHNNGNEPSMKEVYGIKDYLSHNTGGFHDRNGSSAGQEWWLRRTGIYSIVIKPSRRWLIWARYCEEKVLLLRVRKG
jgi:hypothetical protein